MKVRRRSKHENSKRSRRCVKTLPTTWATLSVEHAWLALAGTDLQKNHPPRAQFTAHYIWPFGVLTDRHMQILHEDLEIVWSAWLTKREIEKKPGSKNEKTWMPSDREICEWYGWRRYQLCLGGCPYENQGFWPKKNHFRGQSSYRCYIHPPPRDAFRTIW